MHIILMRFIFHASYVVLEFKTIPRRRTFRIGCKHVIFMSGTVKHWLSAFEVHPCDKQAWLSTPAIICYTMIFMHWDSAAIFSSATTRMWRDWTRGPSPCSGGSVLVNESLMFIWGMKCLTNVTSNQFDSRVKLQYEMFMSVILRFCSLGLGNVSSWVKFQN